MRDGGFDLVIRSFRLPMIWFRERVSAFNSEFSVMMPPK